MPLLKTHSNDKIKNLSLNFVMMFASYFIFFMFIGFLGSVFPGLDLEQYQQTEILELLEKSPIKLFILAIIIAPFLEEGFFRSLLLPTPASLRIFIISFYVLLISLLLPQGGHWTLRFTLIGLSAGFLYYALRELIKEENYLIICRFLSKFHIGIWLIGALLFGYVHIFNYVDEFQFNIVLLVLIFPRIIAGFFFGKVKIENGGFIWPVLMHSGNNLAAVLLMFLIERTGI